MVPQATGLVTFSQFLGGTIGIALAATIFQNKLATGLHQFAPDAPFDLLKQSVTALHSLPESQRAGAIHAYVVALQWAIGLLATVSSGLTSVSALLIRNIDIRAGKNAPGAVKTAVAPRTGEDAVVALEMNDLTPKPEDKPTPLLAMH